MKPKILMIPDRPKWAYESIARGLMKELSSHYDFEIRYANDIEFINKNHSMWDVIFSIGWKWLRREIKTPRCKTVSTIQSHRTLDGKDIEHWVKYLNQRYCAVGATNDELYSMFDGVYPNVLLTKSGVDCRKFSPDYLASSDKLVLGWAGLRSQSKFRGLDLIEEAAEKAGWDLKVQDADKKRLPQDKMPEFYHSLNCYINASESEGGSISVLEACACGLPLLATKTGTATELIVEGKTGYFIERNVDSIVSALKKLNKMQCAVLGTNMRIKVLDEWDWRIRAKGYRNLLELGLNNG